MTEFEGSSLLNCAKTKICVDFFIKMLHVASSSVVTLVITLVDTFLEH